MGIYVIAKKTSLIFEWQFSTLKKMVKKKQLAVFTSDDKAEGYIKDSGWDETETVAEVNPIDFLQWITSIHGKGTQYLAVSTIRDDQEQGLSQPVLNIEEQLLELATVLEDKLKSPAPPPQMETEEVEIFHCEKCGEVMRQPAGRTVPACCDQEMQKPAVDKVTKPRRGSVPSA